MIIKTLLAKISALNLLKQAAAPRPLCSIPLLRCPTPPPATRRFAALRRPSAPTPFSFACKRLLAPRGWAGSRRRAGRGPGGRGGRLRRPVRRPSTAFALRLRQARAAAQFPGTSAGRRRRFRGAGWRADPAPVRGGSGRLRSKGSRAAGGIWPSWRALGSGARAAPEARASGQLRGLRRARRCPGSAEGMGRRAGLGPGPRPCSRGCRTWAWPTART